MHVKHLQTHIKHTHTHTYIYKHNTYKNIIIIQESNTNYTHNAYKNTKYNQTGIQYSATLFSRARNLYMFTDFAARHLQEKHENNF